MAWSKDISDITADPRDPSLPHVDAVLPGQSNQQPPAEDRFHTFGPVGRHYVCFHHLTDLVAVDPRDGKTLWVRGDLPQDCIVFGDDRYVLVLAAHREEALVLRASNGESIGVRKMPPIADERAAASCLATLGRKVLLWQTSKGAQVLSLFDPLEGRSDWPERKFAAGAQACLIEEKALGIMEPSGRFVLYSLPDGRTMAEMKLEAEPALCDITLFESGSRYFLVTSDSPPEDIGRQQSFQLQQANAGLRSICPSKPIHEGRLYAFDRHGKLQWPVPVKIENQRVALNQPTDLPILTFACQVADEDNYGQYRTSLLCIDKRSGRTVYQAEGYEAHDVWGATSAWWAMPRRRQST